MPVFDEIIVTSLVCWCVGVCALRLSLEHHRKTMDFGPEDVCGGPLFAPPFTSARVQSCLEFVELGRDMCTNCQVEIQAGTGISG